MRQLSKKAISLLILAALLFAIAAPAFAADCAHATRTLRVGYMTYPGFLEKTENGEVVGYCAEYLSDICEHMHWQVEYIDTPWYTQLEMLERGELDIVPLAQYSEERAERFLYTRLSVGILQCLLLTGTEANGRIGGLPASYDGAAIGVLRGSINSKLLKEFAARKGFRYRQVEYDHQYELEAALESGEIDIIACEQMVETTSLRILDRFGSAPYFFITSKENRQLMDELNSIMSEINAHDPTYQAMLYQRYFGNGLASKKPFFTDEELDFIANCGEITVTLIPDSKPGSYLDDEGNKTGIVPDVMNKISELSGIKFKYIYSPNEVPPLAYLRENPSFLAAGLLTNNPAFAAPDVLTSKSFYSTYTAMAVRTERARNIDISTQEYTVGTTAAFQAVHIFVNENYPNLTIKDYLTIEDGMQALSSRKIDLFAYDLNSLTPHLANPRFGSLSIIETHFMENPFCTVAVATPENELLISIVDKCISAIPSRLVAQIENDHLKTNVYRYKESDAIFRYRTALIFAAFLIVSAFTVLISIQRIKQRKYTKKIVHLAERDRMTGLYNRETAKEIILKFLASEKDVPCAFLLIDIDGLKKINDSLGHAAGDEAIIGMADVLRAQFRTSDIIARFGGDEYGVFLSGIPSKEVLTPILERLQQAISATPIAEGAIMLGGSVGVAMGMSGGQDLEKMYREADEALYRVKNSGKNGFAYYEAEEGSEA